MPVPALRAFPLHRLLGGAVRQDITRTLYFSYCLPEEVRGVIGDRPWKLAANGIWTLPTARLALRQAQRLDITCFEEPSESCQTMAALRPHCDCAFSAHIIDLNKAVRLGCPDAIVTKVNELGGIRGTPDFVAACTAMGVEFRFHSGETGVGFVAYLHLSAVLEHNRRASQTLPRR